MNNIGAFRFSREWGMPTRDTFDCPPIGEFVRRWLRGAKVSIDPFARNKRLATWMNATARLRPDAWPAERWRGQPHTTPSTGREDRNERSELLAIRLSGGGGNPMLRRPRGEKSR